MAKDSPYATFLNKLSQGGPIVVRNTISGEVLFTIGGKVYFLGSNQTLNLSKVGSLLEIKKASTLHDLIKSGHIKIES